MFLRRLSQDKIKKVDKKPSTDAGRTAKIEERKSEDEKLEAAHELKDHVEKIVEEVVEEKPVMQKTLSISSTSSEKERDIDEDPATLSELEQSGRRKSKAASGVSVGVLGVEKVVMG